MVKTNIRLLIFKTMPIGQRSNSVYSLESQWRVESERRNRILKLMLIVCLVCLIALSLVWFWITQPVLSTAAIYEPPFVDAARLEQHVRKLSVDFVPRDESHPQNLDRVAAYIREQFERAGGITSDQPYTVNNKTYRNVIARFGPDVNQRVIVGAHYDTAGPLSGADDNASGISGLIELGSLLRTAKLKSRVELVAYTLEEPPYFRTSSMGSAVHASSLQKQNADVRAMFSLEMIGYFSDEPNSQQFPVALLSWFYPNKGNFIAVAGRLQDGLLVRKVKAAMRNGSRLPVYSINAPALVAGIDFSDQLNYWNAGYPAIMITDTAFYRNPNYHTSRDTPEKLDYKRMALVVESLYAAVLKLSND